MAEPTPAFKLLDAATAASEAAFDKQFPSTTDEARGLTAPAHQDGATPITIVELPETRPSDTIFVAVAREGSGGAERAVGHTSLLGGVKVVDRRAGPDANDAFTRDQELREKQLNEGLSDAEVVNAMDVAGKRVSAEVEQLRALSSRTPEQGQALDNLENDLSALATLELMYTGGSLPDGLGRDNLNADEGMAIRDRLVDLVRRHEVTDNPFITPEGVINAGAYAPSNYRRFARALQIDVAITEHPRAIREEVIGHGAPTDGMPAFMQAEPTVEEIKRLVAIETQQAAQDAAA